MYRRACPASNVGFSASHSGNNFTNPDPASQTGAVYKGLAIATDSSGRTLLYGKAGCEQA